jgi:type IV pilus assembly protein PilE
LNNKASGFTLVEIVIAAAVVSILAAMAYPNFKAHLATSRRSDAQGALIGMAAAMERYYTANNTYVGAVPGTTLNYSATVPVSGGTPTYNLSVSSATATTYTIQAAPTGTQTGDKCGTLTLTWQGIRGISGAQTGLTVSDCWRS